MITVPPSILAEEPWEMPGSEQDVKFFQDRMHVQDDNRDEQVSYPYEPPSSPSHSAVKILPQRQESRPPIDFDEYENRQSKRPTSDSTIDTKPEVINVFSPNHDGPYTVPIRSRPGSRRFDTSKQPSIQQRWGEDDDNIISVCGPT